MYDIICTRFATEFIIRKSPGESVNVEIVPYQNRPEHERQTLLKFRYELEKFEKLPTIIDDRKQQ